MSLDVTVGSTETSLTTTSALRITVLGATATSTALDAQFSALIAASGKWAENYIGYKMPGVQTYRECLPAYGRQTLMVSRTPVRAVLAVYDATDTGDAVALDSTEFRVEDADAGLITRNQGFGWTATLQPPGSGGPFLSSIPLEAPPIPGQEYRPWMVDYVAGWTYGGLTTASPNWSTQKGTTSTGRTFPEDIEQGILFKAQAIFNGADEAQSEKLGDLEVNYRSLGTDSDGRLITKSEVLLQPYRRLGGF